MKKEKRVFIGTAGWTLPSQITEKFPLEGTHLERYAQVFNTVEINSSFYREHKPDTYAKWATQVPADFCFSVKLSRSFTQEQRLKETGVRLREVLNGPSMLKEKWGALLVQLPPSLEFDHKVAENFLSDLRDACPVSIFWEPRHLSWAAKEAQELLSEYGVSQVFADPEKCEVTKRLRGPEYYRWHGSPVIYKSRYSQEALATLGARVRDSKLDVWCIFDNTTFGFATENAMELQEIVKSQSSSMRKQPI